MLLILMYHRVNNMSTGANLSLFREHLEYLAAQYPIVNLGDPIEKNCINIALTFDDAFFDFYHNAWPILEELKLPAILGVPIKYIQETSNLPISSRLSVKFPNEFEENIYKTQAPFCTWQELIKIAQSDYINIASHSFSHPHLTDKDCDLNQEIVVSKQVLEDKLNTKVNSFIYPFGDMNKKIHKEIAANYDYIFRIGSSLNDNWQHKNKLYYRVDAENFWKQGLELEPKHIRKFRRKLFLNKIRGK